MCRDIFKPAWDALCSVCLDLGLAAQLKNEPDHVEVCLLALKTSLKQSIYAISLCSEITYHCGKV